MLPRSLTRAPCSLLESDLQRAMGSLFSAGCSKFGQRICETVGGQSRYVRQQICASSGFFCRSPCLVIADLANRSALTGTGHLCMPPLPRRAVGDGAARGEGPCMVARPRLPEGAGCMLRTEREDVLRCTRSCSSLSPLKGCAFPRNCRATSRLSHASEKHRLWSFTTL